MEKIKQWLKPAIVVVMLGTSTMLLFTGKMDVNSWLRIVTSSVVMAEEIPNGDTQEIQGE